MELIVRVVGDPFLLLFVGLAPAAAGLSGKPSVHLARFLLVIAWLVGVVGLVRVVAPLGLAAVASAVGILSLLMFTLVVWVQPALVPMNVGKIAAKRALFSTARPRASFEIGASGTIFIPTGGPDDPSFFYEDSHLKVEVYGGRVLVSTQIKNNRGRLLAELVRNEWKVSNQVFDRNYNKDTLEVRGPDGAVVLQVRALPDRVQIQGEWWGSNGRGVRLLEAPGGPGSGARIVFLGRNASHGHEKAIIKPIFRYPSETHLGETLGPEDRSPSPR